ncbi:FMN-binding protein [Streptomyces actuosus]|uniref:FMN-binding protein n=1 Tax=Streptomyces actuosus TaxID=1885 RepID=A0ABS2VQW0_STRAS|nr:FMN-binding protein [Streptomyces actuosus]MBN0045479.1 FMN-binding protein [Streptomyces actuosus]
MRKSHPVRRVVLATAATVSGIVLLLSLKPASGPSAQAAGGALPQATAAGQESPQGGARAVGGGTVTGEAARTQYGTVQVRITVSGGRITRAEAVEAPRGGRSDQITAMAVPRLNEEAVAAQSAQIDAVSGATYTSTGYRQSLQSALDRAKTAGSGGSGGASAAARTVTGDVAQTRYGPVQVRVTVSGGRITRAEAVQAPRGGRSDQISDDALPRLGREAVAAGSADIDAVSGATYTSTGYRQSLQSALDRIGD